MGMFDATSALHEVLLHKLYALAGRQGGCGGGEEREESRREGGRGAL